MHVRFVDVSGLDQSSFVSNRGLPRFEAVALTLVRIGEHTYFEIANSLGRRGVDSKVSMRVVSISIAALRFSF